MDPSDHLELEPQMQIQSEFMDKDTVFEYLRVEGLSVNNLDSEQLILTSTTTDHNESLTSRLLMALSKLYGGMQSKVLCVCFNVSVESTATKYAIQPSKAAISNQKRMTAMKSMTVNQSPR
jgi:hypothetical protein